MVSIGFLPLIVCASANAQGCFDYSPPGPAVSLIGTLRRQDFPGPPNYDSIRKGDKETAIILTLRNAICTNRGQYDEAERNVREIQLVIRTEANWKAVRRLMGKRSLVTGTLFRWHTGHHRTRVLIDVAGIRSVR
jgi:hypothetical protein